MKFAIKSLAVAAALAAAGAASAQNIITAGLNDPRVVSDPTDINPADGVRQAQFTLLAAGGDLAFGNGDYAVSGDPFDIGGTLGALNVGKIAFTGIGGVVVNETYVTDELGDEIRTNVVASSQVSQISAIIDGPDAGKIQVASAVGGARQVGTRIQGTLTGGTADVTNIRFNIAGGQVIADLVGTKAAVGTKPAVVYNSPNTVLWTFDPVGDVVGPTQLKPETLLAGTPGSATYAQDMINALVADGYSNVVQTGVNAQGFAIAQVTANTQLNNLEITSAGAQFFIDALGLLSTGQDALNAVNNSLGKWGSVNSTLTFEVQEVPEPSTYALMGLGLVGISLVARRRAAK